MRKKVFTIKNELGLHARAAALIVQVSNRYQANVLITRDGLEANGKSLLGILTLACPKGSMITINAEGSDAQDVINALEELIENKFGEE